MNNFIYSNTNKRYHTLDYFYKQKFGTKVCKISLNAGFTCPNIDGNIIQKMAAYTVLNQVVVNTVVTPKKI